MTILPEPDMGIALLGAVLVGCVGGVVAVVIGWVVSWCFL